MRSLALVFVAVLLAWGEQQPEDEALTQEPPASTAKQAQENQSVTSPPPQAGDTDAHNESHFNTTAAATAAKDEDDSAMSTKKKRVVNYASMDAGALVLETSSASSGFQNLLLDDKDKYGITPCAEKKMVVIGLSEDIQAREIVLAQYEKYSSGVREFQVFGARVFPTKEWTTLGTFEATFGEGEQTFTLEPKWVRYIKVKFLSHYGNEYSCTLSQIKVHGITMTENFHEDLNRHQEEVQESLGKIKPDDEKENASISSEHGHDEEDAVQSDAAKEKRQQQQQLVDFWRRPVVLQENHDKNNHNLSCLQLLEPTAFKARMRASAFKPSTEVAFVDSQYNSIFKTLMDKIKSFEINQTITDRYLERLHACYTQTLEERDKEQASRFAALRAEFANAHHHPRDDALHLSVQDALVLATLAFVTCCLCTLALVCVVCFRVDRVNATTNNYHYYNDDMSRKARDFSSPR